MQNRKNGFRNLIKKTIASELRRVANLRSEFFKNTLIHRRKQNEKRKRNF